MRASSSLLLLLVALFALSSLACFAAAQTQNVVISAETVARFNQFRIQFDKIYDSLQEQEFRLRVYQENMEYVAFLNAEHNTDVFSVNTPFGDLTQDEFRETILMDPETVGVMLQQLPFDLETSTFSTDADVRGGPVTYFDWRSKNVVTPIKNQGQCGSCWAHAATEAMETAYAQKHGASSLPVLSPQQLVDCDTVDSGCNGGWVTNAWGYLQKLVKGQYGGQQYLSSYAYVNKSGTCKYSGSSSVLPHPATIGYVGSYMNLTAPNNEAALYKVVGATSVATIAVDATNWQYYSSGFFPASACSTNINHAVMVTGYQNINGTDVWNVRNSWGTRWGVSGYLYLPMWINACTVASYANYLTSA